ncbi:S1 family peptidase [Streptomyces cinnamoneus]|uniref:S1 family peptidase n=1 Tax=Streptomyces cinnamoneus TaxID=53446 RepID=UPI0034075680
MKVRRTAQLLAALAVVGAGSIVAIPAQASGEAGGAGGPDLTLGTPSGRPSLDAMAAALQPQLGIPKARIVANLKRQPKLAATAETLRKQLGSRFAGLWIDPVAGTLNANALDASESTRIRGAGAVPHDAAYSMADLERVKAALDKVAQRGHAPKDSSWGINPRTNRVEIDLPAESGGKGRPKAADELLARAGLNTASSAAKITIKHHPGKSARMGLVGGDGLSTARGTCSAGIMVQRGRITFTVTAGHCVKSGDTVSRNDGSGLIGVVEDRDYDRNDFALVGVLLPQNWHPFGTWVTQYNGSFTAYDGWTNATPGANVCKSGVTTGWTCGTVVDDGETWTDSSTPPHTTYNLIKLRDIDAAGGDSGGAVLSGNRALGTVVGGNEQFRQAYVEPISLVLAATNTTVLNWRQ